MTFKTIVASIASITVILSSCGLFKYSDNMPNYTIPIISVNPQSVSMGGEADAEANANVSMRWHESALYSAKSVLGICIIAGPASSDRIDFGEAAYLDCEQGKLPEGVSIVASGNQLLATPLSIEPPGFDVNLKHTVRFKFSKAGQYTAFAFNAIYFAPKGTTRLYVRPWSNGKTITVQ